MKVFVVFVVLVYTAIPVLLYWLGGGNFERGNGLAWCAGWSIAAGTWAAWVMYKEKP
jgi:hypothetical protein